MMNKFFKIIHSNKQDIFNIIIISVIFLICTISLWGYFGSLLYDNGREVYLPELILEGKVLFKDIFGMYGPLSYQINAFLYYIFGHNLSVLYCAGAVNAFLLVLGLYFIFRQFINKTYSTIFVIFISLFIIFNSTTCSNYIFPYAYAMVYALSTMIYSCLFGILYTKNNNKHFYIILSFFMLGISLANKPEFVLCILPLIGALIYNKVTCKIWFKCLFALLLPSIFSWCLLFFNGFSIQDLFQYFDFIHKFFNTEEQKFYNRQTTNFWTAYGLILMIRDFIAACLMIFVPAIIKKLTAKGKIYIILAICTIIIYIPIFRKLGTLAAISYNNLYVSWCALACFYILYKSIKQKNIPLIFLAATGIASCSRSYFILNGGYHIYFSILPITTCLIYFIKHMNINFLGKNEKKYSACGLLLIGVLVWCFNVYNKHFYFVPINFSNKHDIFYTSKYLATPFNLTNKWILNNTKPKDTILVLPEGLFINYITGRKTNPKYYHLIPNHISALDEDIIVENLEKNLPDYFIINNAEYKLYGPNYICKDFGFKICGLIEKNYELTKTFESTWMLKGNVQNFHLKIYKLKE